MTVVGCINGTADCGGYAQYDVLHGTTNMTDYNESNGWMITSFQTNGY